MRYTLTDRAIAILLSVILLLGSAAGFVEPGEENTVEQVNNISVDVPADNASAGNSDSHIPENVVTGDNNGDATHNEEDDDAVVQGNPYKPYQDTDEPSIDSQHSNDESSNSTDSHAGTYPNEDEYDDDDDELIAPYDLLLEITPFSTPHTVTFLVSPVPNSMGTLSASWEGSGGFVSTTIVGVPRTTVPPVPDGTLMEFVAVPQTGHKVVSWNIPDGVEIVDASTPEQRTIRVTAPITVSVVFERAEDIVTYSINPISDPGSGTIRAPEEFPGNAPIPLFTGSSDSGFTHPQMPSNQPIIFTANAGSGYLIGTWDVRVWDRGTSSWGPWIIQQVGRNPNTSLPSNTFISNTRTANTDVRVSFLEGYDVDFRAYLGSVSTENEIGGMQAWYSFTGSSTEIMLDPPVGSVADTAPKGSNIRFQAPLPPTYIDGIPFYLYQYEWAVNGVVDTTQQGRDFTISPLSGNVEVTVTLVRGFNVDYSVVADVAGGALTAIPFYEGNQTTFKDGSVVREGSSVEFQVTTLPPNFLVYQYDWLATRTIGGATIKEETWGYKDVGSETKFILDPVTADVSVVATLVRGHSVKFDVATPDGYIPGDDIGSITASATFDKVVKSDITSGDLQRAGSLITFTATKPVEMDVLAHRWTNLLDGSVFLESSNILTIDQLDADNNIEVEFLEGVRVEFRVAPDSVDPVVMGDIESTPSHIDVTPAGYRFLVVEEGSTVILTAIPDDSDPAVIYRVAKWTVGGVEQTGNNTVLILTNITKPTSVEVHFEEVTLTLNELSSEKVNVTGHGAGFIEAENGLDNNVVVGGNAEGDISFEYFRVLGVDEREPMSAGSFTPSTGLWLTVEELENSTAIRVNSNTNLTYSQNGTYEVRVTREGVTRVLTLVVDLPFIYIKDNTDVVLTTPIEIDNSNNITGESVILHTNAPREPLPIVYETLEFSSGLDQEIQDTIRNALTFTYSDPTPSSPNPPDKILGDRTVITVTADRTLLEDIIDEEITVRVHRGGVSATFTIQLYLVPPPRIDTITPVPSLLTVGVHGAPAGTPLIPLIAVFEVEGEYLDAENKDDVIASFKPENITHPTWITAGAISVVVHDSESATVTFELIVDPNSDKDDEHYGKDGRDGKVTINTDLPKLPEHEVEVNELTVRQSGPIVLTPPVVFIWNHNLEEVINVAGYGDITINAEDLAELVENVTLLGPFKDGDDDVLTITARRPFPNEADIIDYKQVIRVTREGITAELTILVNLTKLDIPRVTWPEGMTATYRDFLSTVAFTNSDLTPWIKNGFADFTVGDVTRSIPGTFSWASPGERVGDAGLQSPVMVFTPHEDYSDEFAIVRSDEIADDAKVNDVIVDVAKATPVIAVPTEFELTYGQTLSEAEAVIGGTASFDGEDVPGTFVFSTPTYMPVVAESGNYFSVTFTPTDSANYNSVPLNLPVTVDRARQDTTPVAPTYEEPEETSITELSIILRNQTNPNLLNEIRNAEFIIWPSTGEPTEEEDWVNAIRIGENNITALVFDGLIPGTEYHFFARFPGGDNHYPSEPSDVGSISTLPAPMAGNPVIVGSKVFAEEFRAPVPLYVDTSSIYSNPPGDNDEGRYVASKFDFEFEWFRYVEGSADILLATAATYIPVSADIDSYIYVVVSAVNAKNDLQTVNFGPIERRMPVLADFEYSDFSSSNFVAADTTIRYTEEFNRLAHPVAVQTASDIEGMGMPIDVLYRLYDPTEDDDTVGWSLTVPVNVGVYQVKIVTDEGANYLAFTKDNILDGFLTITRVDPRISDMNALLGWTDAGLIGRTAPFSTTSPPSVTWIPRFLTNPPEAIITAAAGTNLDESKITILYSPNGSENGSDPTFPPRFPEEVITVTANIEAHGNFNAANGIFIGTYSIVGDDIIIGDITINGVVLGSFTGISKEYDAAPVSITVVDNNPNPAMATVIEYRHNLGGTLSGWSSTPPSFTNATQGVVTVEFRVTRPGTGFNTLNGSTTVLIRQVELTPTIDFTNVIGKTYDATTALSGTATISLSGAVNGESPAAEATFAFVDANVGTNKGVNATGITLIGTWGLNYRLSSTSLTNQLSGVAITQRTLTPTINFAGVPINKVYDSTTAINDPQPTITLTGAVGGQNPVALATFAFVDANVGTNKGVTATGIALTGTWGLNYRLSATTLENQLSPLNITHRLLTPSIDFDGILGKVYDSTTAIEGTQPRIVLTGAMGSDEPTASATFDFVDANVGPNKGVNATGIVLDGTWGLNYTLSATTLTNIPSGVAITQRTLIPAISFTNVSGKVYDANTSIIGTQPTITLTGAAGGQSPAASATFAFVDAIVGTNKGVTASGITLTGTWGQNYVLSATTIINEPSGVDITPKQLSWSTGNKVNDKTYDGNRNTTFISAPTLVGLVGTETVTIVPGSVLFDSRNAGPSVGVTALGWGIAAGFTNYAAPTEQPSFDNAEIFKLELVWEVGSSATPATVEDRAYNGGTNAVVVDAPTLRISGIIPGDTVTVLEGEANFVQSDADDDIEVIGSKWGLDGEHADNYFIASQPLFENAEITKLNLGDLKPEDGDITITIDGTYIFTGAPIVPPSGVVTVNVKGIGDLTFGEDADFVITSVSNNTNAGTAVLTITGRGNYVGTATGTFTIEPRPIRGSVYIDVESGLGAQGQITTGTVLVADIDNIYGVPGGVPVVNSEDLRFRWYRIDSTGTTLIQNIPGEAGRRYMLTASDSVDTEIILIVTGIDNYTDDVESTYSVTVGSIPISGKFSISGETTLGSELSILWDEDEPLTPEEAEDHIYITWLRDGVPIAGENGETYEITQEDLGKRISVEIVGTNGFTGSMRAYLYIPAIAPYEVQNLTATPGDTVVMLEWSAPDFNGGSEITGYQVSIDGGDTWVNVGLVTTFEVTGLTNRIEYTFGVRATNSMGESEAIFVTATPVAPPQVVSIAPSETTAVLFASIPEEGFTETAVFEVVGTDLTAEAVLAANAFSIFAFPAWAFASNLSVEFISPEKAIVTITVTVLRTNEAERTGDIVITNAITGEVTGTLAVTQDAVSPPATFRVFILNAPNGAGISGQSAAVRTFEPGSSVSLVAGRSNGYSFNNWSTASEGVTLGNASNASTAFTMPANDVIITANWASNGPQPPPVPPPGQTEPPGTDDSDGTDDPDGTDDTDDTTDSTDPDTDTDDEVGPGIEEGNGSGDSYIGPAGTDRDIPDEPTPTHESGFGFWQWLRDNFWWIWLSIGALSLLVFFWFILLGRRRRKEEEEALDAMPVNT